MRILHTADLHLGRTLEGQNRLEEQVLVLNEIVDIVKEKSIDLVLLAGDIFDTFNPSADAEQLFYNFLRKLTVSGETAVIIIAGNHDQPERLTAASPLIKEQGVFILGRPQEKLTLNQERWGQISLAKTGQNWLELSIEKVEKVTYKADNSKSEKVVIAALPYLSEARLDEIWQEDIKDDAEYQKEYSKKISCLIKKAAKNFKSDSINIIMAHLFALGGTESKSERQILVGGSFGVNLADFPKADYIALGHLHRPQKLKGHSPTYYAGSPLAYSFSEANQVKTVNIIDAKIDNNIKNIKVEQLALKSGCKLIEHEAENYQEALDYCQNLSDDSCWLNISIKTDDYLAASQIKELRQAHKKLLHILPVFPELLQEQEKAKQKKDLTIKEEFIDFAYSIDGVKPEDNLVQAFLDLINLDFDDNN